jgi:hypothetical protein
MMKCAHCKRADRALFARLISGCTYIVLCDVCLRQKNEQILLELDHLRTGSLPEKSAWDEPRIKCTDIKNSSWRGKKAWGSSSLVSNERSEGN